LARIKSGLEATAETRNHWHEAEVTERMAAGGIPRGVAEKEIAELHSYSAKTYRASERAIQRGVSLDATDVYAPEDPAIIRRRKERRRRGYAIGDRTPDCHQNAKTSGLEMESPEPQANDLNGPENEEYQSSPTAEIAREKEECEPLREPSREPGKRLTGEELRQLLDSRERELVEARKKHNAERGIDRNNAQDRGLGLADCHHYRLSF